MDVFEFYRTYRDDLGLLFSAVAAIASVPALFFAYLSYVHPRQPKAQCPRCGSANYKIQNIRKEKTWFPSIAESQQGPPNKSVGTFRCYDCQYGTETNI